MGKKVTSARQRAYRKYAASEKGKEVARRYRQSEKTRILRRAYERKKYAEDPEKRRKICRKSAAKRYALNPEKFLSRSSSFARTIKGRYTRLKSRAKKKNKEFKISYDQYEKLILNKTCDYCLGSLPETGGGLDRIDWKRGYTIDNVVPCCKSCNDKKGALERIGFLVHRIKELLKELNGR